LPDEKGRWPADELKVPQGVRIVISHRLKRLREETRRLLTKAAVIGRSFNFCLLEDLEGSPPDTLFRALEEAEHAYVVLAERNGREIGYRFVHELVRQTLYETLTLPRRQQLHAHIANAIEHVYSTRLQSHAAALAHHLYQAGAQADLDKTVSYLVLAARLASTAAAHEEALTHVDNALFLLGTEQYRGAAELDAIRAVALRSVGRWTEAIESYERAIDKFVMRGDIQGAAEASFYLVYIHAWNANNDRALTVINRVLRFIDEPSPFGYRLLLLKTSVFCSMGEMQRALSTRSEAKDMEGRLPVAAKADGFASMCEARMGFMTAQLDKAGECGREARRHFRAAGDLWGEADTFEPVASALWTGHPLEVEAMVADSIACADKIGHQSTAWAYRKFFAQSLMAQGDLEESERIMREVHELATAKSAGSWHFLDHIVLGAIAQYRGNFDEALVWVRRGIEKEPPSYQSGHLSGMLFWILPTKGDREAEATLSAARVHLPVPGSPLSLGACGCLALVIEGLAFLGRFEDAAALKSSAEHVVANGPLCVYSQHLFRTSAGIAAACARDWIRAEEHHRIAIHQADSSPYRVSQTGARYWYAEMLCKALALHESMGMKWHVKRVATRIAQL
jgi:tetratricopeptide (TPR) repeat protein